MNVVCCSRDLRFTLLMDDLCCELLLYFSAAAVDSRLEFSEQTPLRYTLLLGRAFPRLIEFTIAFWIKVKFTDTRRCNNIIA